MALALPHTTQAGEQQTHFAVQTLCVAPVQIHSAPPLMKAEFTLITVLKVKAEVF